MHVTMIKTQEYDNPITVFHNSDWSGPVEVRWEEFGKGYQVSLPGALLLALSKEATQDDLKNKIISFIEQL